MINCLFDKESQLTSDKVQKFTMFSLQNIALE